MSNVSLWKTQNTYHKEPLVKLHCLFLLFMQIGYNIILFDSSYEVLLSSMPANHEDASGQGY